MSGGDELEFESSERTPDGIARTERWIERRERRTVLVVRATPHGSVDFEIREPGLGAFSPRFQFESIDPDDADHLAALLIKAARKARAFKAVVAEDEHSKRDSARDYVQAAEVAEAKAEPPRRKGGRTFKIEIGPKPRGDRRG